MLQKIHSTLKLSFFVACPRGALRLRSRVIKNSTDRLIKDFEIPSAGAVDGP